MDYITEKFLKLGVDNAPGQEVRQKADALPLIGEPLEGTPVDFSHGDVDAHPPIPGSFDHVTAGFQEGAAQAYTEYRGRGSIRTYLAEKLAEFSGAPVDADQELILTAGTQGALFLAMGSLIGRGDKVGIIVPDYFANRKLVEFFDGELVPIPVRWEDTTDCAGLDLVALEAAFKDGMKLFLYSNPNNPTGVIYSAEEVATIGRLAKKYGVAVIADELYSRQLLDTSKPYTHLRAQAECPDQIITIMGPSKTESLSGFRLGAAYGTPAIIARMEKLQAIMCLRTAGYCQAAYLSWFSEPEQWMENRIADHRAIRDALLAEVAKYPDCWARPTEGGSYIFLKLPQLTVSQGEFTKICRIQAGVTVTPGSEFGPDMERYYRLNFSQNHDAAAAAVGRICQLAQRYR